MLLELTSDERLVEDVRAGSERAFEVLCDRHYQPVLAFCGRILGSSADAEDAVQHTFLAAYGALIGSDRPIVVRPWLYTIARHRCVSMLRARHERPSDQLPDPGADNLAAEVATREEVRTTFGDLARLPDDQRAALLLAELGDASHDEIARVLGCRRDKVKALVFQARTSLTADRTARETPCADIRTQLAAVGGALRHTILRRHVRACPGCRAFRRQLQGARPGLGLLLPGAGLKRAVIGAVSGSGGAGAGGAALTAGALGGGSLAATALVVIAVAGGGGTTAAPSAEPDAGDSAPAVAAVQRGVHPAPSEPAAVVRRRGSLPADVPDRAGARADDGALQDEVAGSDGRLPAPDACCSTERASAAEPATAPGVAAPPSDHPPAAEPDDDAEDADGGGDEAARLPDGEGRGHGGPPASTPGRQRGEGGPPASAPGRQRGQGEPPATAPGQRGHGPENPPARSKPPDERKPPAGPPAESSGPPQDAGPPESSGPPSSNKGGPDEGGGSGHGSHGNGKP